MTRPSFAGFFMAALAPVQPLTYPPHHSLRWVGFLNLPTYSAHTKADKHRCIPTTRVQTVSPKTNPQRSAIAQATTSASPAPVAATITPFDQLPDSALLRESQLVKKPNNPAPVIPISPATLWRWVRLGQFPAPLKIGQNITAWRVADVRAWMQSQAAA